MKSSYEVRAMRFIRQIAPIIKDCHEPHQFFRSVAKYNIIYHRKVEVHYGISRVALVTSDYVVKFDYDTTEFGSCETEYDTYQRAVEDGYDYLLAKITPYYYAGICAYIMPRIYGIGREYGNAEQYCTWRERMWLRQNTSDLHNQNYGWKDGHIVIFDYAAEA